MDKRILQIIREFNIRPVKSLGQNFLTDESIIRRIPEEAKIGKDDLVIEVGPGTGNLTKELAVRSGRVVAVEIDRRLIPVLSDKLKDFSNIVIINDDILKTDIKKDIIDKFTTDCGKFTTDCACFKPQSVKVVANLPYYITTPVIMKFLEGGFDIDIMVFMVQKEVAERMIASPGGKDYGALSIAVQFYSKPEIIMEVAPGCFIPEPGVYSAVVRLNAFRTPPVELADRKLFFKVVKAAFGQRRKTLANALSNSGYFTKNKDEIKEMLIKLGIGEKQRGETLSVMQFAELSNLFSKN